MALKYFFQTSIIETLFLEGWLGGRDLRMGEKVEV